jgi:hypothetical protein
MFADMERSDRDEGFRERFAARRDTEADQVSDWLRGPGATVLGVGAAIVLAVFAFTLLRDLAGAL